MIHVHSFYQNVAGAKIPSGDYANDDPGLCGLADYLVENGHATRMDSEPLGVVEAPHIALVGGDATANELIVPIDFSKAALELMEANQLTADDFAGFEGKVTINDVRDKISGEGHADSD